MRSKCAKAVGSRAKASGVDRRPKKELHLLLTPCGPIRMVADVLVILEAPRCSGESKASSTPSEQLLVQERIQLRVPVTVYQGMLNDLNFRLQAIEVISSRL